MRALSVVAIGLVGLLGGCGDDGLNIDSNAGNACGEIAKVACHNLYQCCSEGEIENFLNVGEPRTEVQCREDVRRLCERSIATLDDAIAKNRVRFDSNIMNNCLEALIAPDDTCASVVENELPWAEECMNTAWVGLVATGGMCLSSFECMGAPDSSACAQNRTCVAKPGNGMPCGAIGCATGLFCQTGTCRPRLGAGQMCQSDLQCLDDLFCDFNSPTPTCTALRADGQVCTSDQSCASGDCIPGVCANFGSTCFDDTDCPGTCADDGSFCNTDSNCQIGMCSMTGTTCSVPTQCTGAGNVCVFPVRCNPGDCAGDIVCAARTLVVDYCEDALGDLPFPN